jgi:hypothetical protein
MKPASVSSGLPAPGFWLRAWLGEMVEGPEAQSLKPEAE